MSLEDLSIEQLRELAAKAQAMEPSYKLVNELSKDPEMRTYIQRHFKKKNPNISMPEIEAEDRVMAALDAEKKEREKLAEKIQAEEIRRRVEADRAAVIERYKLSEDDIKAVEKRMVKSDDNPDPLPPRYEWAVPLYLNSRTPSTPTPSSFMPPTYTMPEGKTWGKGIGNAAALNRIAMDEAYRAFADIKGGKVAS